MNEAVWLHSILIPFPHGFVIGGMQVLSPSKVWGMSEGIIFALLLDTWYRGRALARGDAAEARYKTRRILIKLLLMVFFVTCASASRRAMARLGLGGAWLAGWLITLLCWGITGRPKWKRKRNRGRDSERDIEPIPLDGEPGSTVLPAKPEAEELPPWRRH